MEAISLKNPYPNGVAAEEKYLLDAFLCLLKGIRGKVNAGKRVYVKITAGERKGSIAYIKGFDIAYNNDEPHIYGFRRNGGMCTIGKASLRVILAWDGRRNKIKWSTSDTCEYLHEYDGPTVWEKLGVNYNKRYVRRGAVWYFLRKVKSLIRRRMVK